MPRAAAQETRRALLEGLNTFRTPSSHGVGTGEEFKAPCSPPAPRTGRAASLEGCDLLLRSCYSHPKRSYRFDALKQNLFVGRPGPQEPPKSAGSGGPGPRAPQRPVCAK